MNIGQAARATGTSARMLRYYESKSLIVPARDAAGYRTYSPADVMMIRRVRLLMGAGVTTEAIARIKGCIACDASAMTALCPQTRELLNGELARIDGEVEHLTQARGELEAILARNTSSTV